MFFKKLILNLLLIIFFTISIYSIQTNLKSIETIDATQISENQVTINVNGNINITNPSTLDNIYQFEFIFRNDLTFNFNILTQNISYSNFKFKGNNIDANSSKIISYSFQTTIPLSYYNNFKNSQKSFLEWSSSQILLKPLRNIKLNKAQRDNQSLNYSSRTIYITGQNPTSFNVTINSIDLYKTNAITNNDFLNSEYLLNSFTNLNLNPQENFFIKHNELNSSDEDIYWIDSIVSTKYTFLENVTLNFKIQIPSKGGSSSTISFNSKNEKDLIFIKRTNTNEIKLNKPIEFSLEIQNPNNYRIKNLIVEDSLPRFILTNQSLNYKIDEILEHETKQIKYNAKLTKKISDVVFIPPAKLTYNGKFLDSNSLYLVIEDINLKDQLILEKSITHFENQTSKVQIKIKNIGKTDINNINLIENTNSNNQKEIKTWTIPTLESNQEWKTSYTVNTKNLNYFIPNIFIEQNIDIYETINTNEIIDASFNYVDQTTFTTVLIITTALLFFTDLIF